MHFTVISQIKQFPVCTRAKTLQERLNSQKKLDTVEFATFFKSPCMPRLGKKACLFPKCKQKK